MHKETIEGSARISIAGEDKISKKLPVFYNPVMKFNRDMSVLLLRSFGRKGIKIGDPLAGSGVRGIRMLTELPKSGVGSLWMNDHNPRFPSSVKESLGLSKVKPEQALLEQFFGRQHKMRTTAGFQEGILGKAFTAYNSRVVLSNIDANLFLLLSPGFDYIDIDPFGSPNPFLDASCMRLARGGTLAVTATDTSSLCGTHPAACRRKYWAEPMHNELMHEAGLRILIRKVQLIASQYDKALVPVFCYSRDHYLRAFFRCAKGKQHVDALLRKHDHFPQGKQTAGPCWLGQLWDHDLVREMYLQETDRQNRQFLGVLRDESAVQSVGFHDIHALCKQHRVKDIPPLEAVLLRLHQRGHAAARTHFSHTGVRTTAREEDMAGILKKKA